MSLSKFICHNCDKSFSSKQMLEKHIVNNVCGSQNKKEQTISLVSLDDKITSIYNLLMNKEEKELIKTLKEKISFLELQLIEERRTNKEKIKNLEDEINDLKKSKKSPSKSKEESKKSPPKPKKEESKEESKEEPKEESNKSRNSAYNFNKNKNGKFMNSLGYIFDNNIKKITEKYMLGTDKYRPLNMSDKAYLDHNKFKYDITTFSDYVKKTEEEEDKGEYEKVKDAIDKEKKRIKDNENKFFDIDENGNYHIGGILKSDVDLVKNLNPIDRKHSKILKSTESELSADDKKQILKYIDYKPDMKTLEELYVKLDEILYF